MVVLVALIPETHSGTQAGGPGLKLETGVLPFACLCLLWKFSLEYPGARPGFWGIREHVLLHCGRDRA